MKKSKLNCPSKQQTCANNTQRDSTLLEAWKQLHSEKQTK